MKKLALILVAAGLIAYPAFGQTISVVGDSGSASAGGIFDTQITLQITGGSDFGDVESLNMVLRTPSSGPTSGVGFFTVQFLSANAPFSQANNPAPSTFTDPGDANNSGFTIEPNDMGANAPADMAVAIANNGFTSIPVDILRFTIAPNTPAGIYHFSATLGGFADASQGSYIANSQNFTFDVNDVPDFTIEVTAVPEPATWALVGLGGLALLRLNRIRSHRKD